MAPLSVRMAHTLRPAPGEAVSEIRAGVEQPDLRLVLAFCSARYDLDALGRELARAFSCPILACTSAGQLGPSGYERGGLSAASLAGDGLRVETHLLAPLGLCRREAARLGARVRKRLVWGPGPRRGFGLLVVDGLSRAEEALAVALYEALGGFPVVGGSAADDLAFARTAVYWDGAFRPDAAVLAVCETSLPFRTFHLHHFRPTERRVVVTDCDPAARVVRELDGRPAAETYALAAGVPASALGPDVFARHPLLLRIGDAQHVRGIRAAEADGSLGLYCAIDEGLVLSLGTPTDPLEALDRGLGELAREVGGRPVVAGGPFVIGFDSMLRRLELERARLDGAAGRLLAERGVFGFGTYGEQHAALHLNQTLTGVAVGG